MDDDEIARYLGLDVKPEQWSPSDRLREAMRDVPFPAARDDAAQVAAFRAFLSGVGPAPDVSKPFVVVPREHLCGAALHEDPGLCENPRRDDHPPD